MTDLDPYFRNSLDANRQVVLAARPIIIEQGDAGQDGVVSIAAERDVIVIADEVTIKGAIVALHHPSPVPSPWPSSSQDAGITGPSGCTVLILARSIDTIPGKGADGKATDARLDVSGGVGKTSTKIWAGPAASGAEGERGHSIWHVGTDDVAPGGTGGKGDPGQPGDEGGDGGIGGTIDIRCGFTAPTTALAAAVDGGHGGDGLAGQVGGTGGPGGPGADSEVMSIPFTHPSAATKGGAGGPGGTGGNGGAAGRGGAPGTVRIRVRNGQQNGITTSLQAGSPGAAGDAGGKGEGGPEGGGGRYWGVIGQAPPAGGGGPLYGWMPPEGGLGRGLPGDPGSKPGAPAKGADGTADVIGTCDDSELVKFLTFPVTAQTALLLDRIQVDYLAATGAVDPESLSALADRIDWTNALLRVYSPVSADETSELDSQRAAAVVVKERFQAALDFYGNAADYAPLGSIQRYQARFARTLTALVSIQGECDDRVNALEGANRTASDLNQAQGTLKQQQRAYDAATATERTTIANLITQIATADAEAIAAKDTLVNSAFTEFENAVQASCGISKDDLIDVVGQLAFLGQEPFQAGAMILSQSLKLGEAAGSHVLDADGSPVDKSLVIGQLTAIDLSKSKLTGIVGGESGVRLSDPGAIKLIAEQSQLDQLCDKFWNVSGAAEAKETFDEYVSAVQVRNAHIVTLNESLSRLRAYVAGSAQTAAALATAQTQAAASTDAGAVTLVTQLTRMASRARADCIEALYLASRAYSFWALEPADALAGVLSDLSTGRPLAMTPTALQAAGEQLLTRYDKAIDADLGERPIWFPPANAPAGTRGKMIELTPQSHKAVFDQLRAKGRASFQLTAPRASTKPASNDFAGLSDVRLASIRCWLSGVRWKDGHGRTIRVDLQHQGRETLVSRENTVAVFRHEPVHVVMEYDSTKPLDPAGIVAASDLQDGDSNAIGAFIGPFARWRISVSDDLNPGVDLSTVDKITLEIRGSAQTFGMPQSK